MKTLILTALVLLTGCAAQRDVQSIEGFTQPPVEQLSPTYRLHDFVR